MRKHHLKQAWPLARSAALGAALYFAFLQQARAYIDPAAGTYLLQMLIAGLAVGLFSMRMFWDRIKSFFRKNIPPDGGEHPDNTEIKPEDRQ